MQVTIQRLLIIVSIVFGVLFGGLMCLSLLVAFSGELGLDNTIIGRIAGRQSDATTEPILEKPAPEESENGPALEFTPEPTSEASPNSPEESESGPALEFTPEPVSEASPNSPSDNLTWNGLTVDVTQVNYDAWPLIKAQNHNNEPPLEGMSMLMVTVRVTNVDGVEGEPIAIVDSDFQVIGDRGVAYQTFRASCGVVPDNLDGVVAVDHSMDGNICFQVPQNEQGFQLIYEPFDTPATYFELPSRQEAASLTPEQRPVLVEAEQLTWNGLKIDIADVDFDAWALIKTHNNLNDPPLPGMNMVLITVRITNVDGVDGEPVKVIDSDFQLIGDHRELYTTFQPGCGVIPDEINGVVAVEGSPLEAKVCFQVPSNEDGFQLIYEASSNSPAIYFEMPSRK